MFDKLVSCFAKAPAIRDQRTGRFLPGNPYRFTHRTESVCGRPVRLLAQDEMYGSYRRLLPSYVLIEFPHGAAEINTNTYEVYPR